MKKKTMIILSVTVLVLAVAAWGIWAAVECSDISDAMGHIIRNEIDEDTEKYIRRTDDRIAKVGFWGKLFLSNMEEYLTKKEENEDFIHARAEEVSAGIAALEPCTYISSKEHYGQIRGQLAALTVSDTTEFGKRVLALVENYDDLAAYRESFETLLETYKHDCGRCHGSGRISCSYCDGRGSKPVVFYEYGDWGETSYSNYDCPQCDGKGKKDCENCDNGWYYYFDGVPAMDELDGVDAVLASFLAGETDDGSRAAFLKTYRDQFMIENAGELNALFLRDSHWIMVNNASGAPLMVWEYLESGDMCYLGDSDGKGGMITTTTERNYEGVHVEEDILCLEKWGDFRVRMLKPGCFAGYQINSGEEAEEAWMLLIRCDKNGVPIADIDMGQNSEETPAEYTMSTALKSYFNFGKDTQQRSDFLTENRDSIPVVTEAQLGSIFAEYAYILEVPTVDAAGMDLYQIVDRSGDAGSMYIGGTITAESNGVPVIAENGREVEFALEDGLLRRTISVSLRLREAAPGYYFGYRVMAGGEYDAPMYLYVLCDYNGQPLYPIP